MNKIYLSLLFFLTTLLSSPAYSLQPTEKELKTELEQIIQQAQKSERLAVVKNFSSQEAQQALDILDDILTNDNLMKLKITERDYAAAVTIANDILALFDKYYSTRKILARKIDTAYLYYFTNNRYKLSFDNNIARENFLQSADSHEQFVFSNLSPDEHSTYKYKSALLARERSLSLYSRIMDLGLVLNNPSLGDKMANNLSTPLNTKPLIDEIEALTRFLQTLQN